MVNYKDLGLVNTRDMFAKAIKGGYAIPAFNFNNMEQMQAIIKAAVETKSPVNYVAILHYVFFTFKSNFTFFSSISYRTTFN